MKDNICSGLLFDENCGALLFSNLSSRRYAIPELGCFYLLPQIYKSIFAMYSRDSLFFKENSSVFLER